MANKKKLQHYVPQCYLRAWAANNKNQVYVYNKELKKSYLANIHDVACERYFYDIDWSKLITPDLCEKYGISQDAVQSLKDEQAIENYFAEHVEGEFTRILSTIIKRVGEMNQWEIKNCWFISEEDKQKLSFHLMLQYLRVSSIRSLLEGFSDILSQILHDMGASQEMIDQNTLSKEQASLVHAQLMFDKDNDDIYNGFYFKKWLLLINRTNQPFFTSDSPIGIKSCSKLYKMDSPGLNSPNVEVSFPISPNLMLMMSDERVFKSIGAKDRYILELDKIEVVRNYNYYSAAGNSSLVISNTGDFSLIDEIIEKQPTAMSLNHSSAVWGGKKYTPRL